MYRLKEGEYIVDFQVRHPPCVATRQTIAQNASNICSARAYAEFSALIQGNHGVCPVSTAAFAARPRAGIPSSAGYCSGAELRVRLTLQRLHGELFLFMDLCGKLFCSLRL